MVTYRHGEDIHDRALALAVLRTHDDTTVQTLFDLGSTALATGEAQSARLLFRTGFLSLGFGTAALARYAEIGKRTNLWSSDYTQDPHQPRVMLKEALIELKGLLAIPNKGVSRLPTRTVDPGNDAGSISEIESLVLIVNLALDDLFDQNTPDVSAFLGKLAVHLVGPIVDLTRHAAEPGKILAMRFALNALRLFYRKTTASLGDPAFDGWLINATSRLSDCGLGAYLSNVDNVVLHGADVPAFLELADPEIRKEDLANWSISISANLSVNKILQIIQFFLKQDDISTVDKLIIREREGALSRADRSRLWPLRDVCLEEAYFSRAAALQRTIATLAAKDQHEWSILGDILAVSGDRDGARDAYTRSLAVAPQDTGVRQRWAALEAGTFMTIAKSDGFFSARERRQFLGVARREPRIGYSAAEHSGNVSLAREDMGR